MRQQVAGHKSPDVAHAQTPRIYQQGPFAVAGSLYIRIGSRVDMKALLEVSLKKQKPTKKRGPYFETDPRAFCKRIMTSVVCSKEQEPCSKMARQGSFGRSSTVG